MKILYLSSVRIPSEKASGLAIVRQCQAFVDIGHEVELVIPDRSPTYKKTIELEYGITPKFHTTHMKSKAVYSLGKFGFGLMLLYEGLRMYSYYLVRKNRINIVYSRDQRLLFPFMLFGSGNKCYLELHTKHTDIITRLVARRVKKLVVISQGLRELYENQTARKDIQVEPSGVDLEQFKGLPSKEVLRTELGLPQDKIIFGYVGKYKTMGESKGVEQIIEAFAQAYEEDSRIFLFLVGIENDEKEEILSICEKAKLPISAFTLSSLRQDKFARYLMASDVLLMNYPNTEHYAKYMSPTKFFAYLATGKPIISSDLPSVREVVGNSTVLFIGLNDVKDYCDKILLEAKGNFNFKIKARENNEIVKKFSWGERAKRLLN